MMHLNCEVDLNSYNGEENKIERNEELDMTSVILSGLDVSEILAARENLESALRLVDGPAARRIPESMCVEIGQILYLLELAVRRHQEIEAN